MWGNNITKTSNEVPPELKDMVLIRKLYSIIELVEMHLELQISRIKFVLFIQYRLVARKYTARNPLDSAEGIG
jgi:hypothetical protein